MNNNLILRPIKKSDYKELERIVKETWQYETFCSPKVAKKMARLYLASCLTNQSFTCVAEKDGTAVGIIMGHNKNFKKAPFKYTLRTIFSYLSIIITNEGRKTTKIYKGISDIDKELLESCGKDFKGELAFFVLDAKVRGEGIGAKLFSQLVSYMKSQEIDNFYLYTDTSCNYGFYEHKGMRRISEKTLDFRPFRKDKMSFFLYEY